MYPVPGNMNMLMSFSARNMSILVLIFQSIIYLHLVQVPKIPCPRLLLCSQVYHSPSGGVLNPEFLTQKV